jgi:cell division protein FtsX
MSQAISALTVGFLLLLSGFLFWMEMGLRPVLTRLKGEQVITAYLDPALETAKEKGVVDQIRTQLGARPELKLVGSPQFVEELKVHYPELGRELEDLGGELTTIIPRFVTVTGMLPDSAVEQVRRVPGVQSAESSKDRYQQIVGAFSTLRTVARVLAAGLLLALLTGLIHLSRMNAALHHEAISLLRLWGAGQGSLRAPGLLSGLFVGLTGGLIAAAGWAMGGVWLALKIKTLSPMLATMPLPRMPIGLMLFVAGALLGLVAGALSGVSPAVRGGAGRAA